MIQSERIHGDHVSSAPHREIDVRALIGTLWSHKYIVAVTSGLCVILAVYLALTAIPIFRGQVTVAEVHESGVGGLGAIAGQFGGLASLAGVNLHASGQDQERQAVLESRRLVEEFVKRNDVLPLLARGAKEPPTLWAAVEKFRKNALIITEDKLKGVTTVSIDWTDPVLAARWANGFVELANELVRTRAINEASGNITYLNRQIAQTNVLELRRVMYDLVEQETKTLMLASGRVDYAFTIVDPAVPPEKRISPKRTLMVLSGLVIGRAQCPLVLR